MQILSLGVADDPVFVYERLKRQLDRNQNVKGLFIEPNQCGSITFYGIFLSDDELKKNFDLNAYERVKCFVADAIANVIIEYTKEKFLFKLIKDHYYFLDEIEAKKIFQESQKRINELTNAQSFSKVKFEIIKKVLDFLDSNFEFNFEGFLTFRLKDYIKTIQNIVEDVTNKYLLEREYFQFINLLKYFTDIQESKIEHVDVIPTAKMYLILDREGNEIKDEFYELLSKNFKLNLSKEDILLSRLISLSPQNIVFHKHQGTTIPEDIIEILYLVFDKKLQLCSSCKIKCADASLTKSEE
ncbi:putative sporulation protein YtxC [Anaerocellum danielii]|uniref:Sporulation protein YtxC n=1 Tax=Anaerocellum danielii TaxID=1387557 RepID=A0ABZ0TYH4_9FIRM|nr:putative sporulation protein YtxC [Caldicellulosiruptor danielii]WPX07922.1 putative sporulation protein YtxC [Caldicellulosiruptor danielii]